jgi:transcriptional accessory protein Tex/SPT6
VSEAVSASSQEAATEASETTGETSAEVAETAQATVEEVSAQVEEAADAVSETVSDPVEETTEAVAEQAEAAADAVSETDEASAEVAETAQMAVEEVSAQVEEAADAVSETVNETAAEEAMSAEEQEASDAEKQVVYLSVGQEVSGTVKRATEFGAFVDIGAGRDGLIHISEMAVGRVNKVGDVLKEGQQITCWIKKLDRKRNRISLTLVSPETKTIKDLSEGDVVPGTVSKIMPYGAFIDLGVGTDGLLHIREMSNGYVNKPEDVVQAGEKIEVRIIGVDRRRRRIDLSLKGLRDEPEAEIQDAQPEAVAVEEEADVVDNFAEVEVLSPMELAFKRAIEADGSEMEMDKGGKKSKRNKQRNRAIQEEIIIRTLSSMKE